MAGYTRQDNTGQIANNEVIDADDLNAEFNAVKVAFQGAGGHDHDPSSSNSGAPIEKVGPAGQITVNATQVLPNGDNTIDLGGSTSSARFKNGRFGSTVSAATLDGDTVVAGSSGYMTLTDNELDVSSGNLLVDVAGDMTVDVAGGNILLKDAGVDFGSLNNVSGNMTIKSGTTDALQFTDANADFQGTLDVTLAATLDNNLTVLGNVDFSNSTVGGTFTVTPPSTFTGLVTGSGGFSGLLTGNVKGDVLATDGTTILNNGVIEETDSDGNITQQAIPASLTGTVSSLSNHNTDDLSEGTSNLYFTTARVTTPARSAISVTDSGGDGSLAYDSTSGAFTYTGPSATDTRGHFSGGTGVSIVDGEVAIGQAVGTTDDVTFNNTTISGNLTVSGTTTTVNSTTVTVDDPIFTLGAEIITDDEGNAIDDNKDRGIEFNWHNGTAAKLGFFGFDDSSGKFTFIPDATNSSEVFTGTAGTVVASTFEGNVSGESMTSSTDITLDATGDIILDADGNDFIFKNGNGGDTATLSFADNAALKLSNSTTTTVETTDSGADIKLTTLDRTGGVKIHSNANSTYNMSLSYGDVNNKANIHSTGGLLVSSEEILFETSTGEVTVDADLLINESLILTEGTQNWTVTASGANLTFAYDGDNKMRIDSSGNLTVKGNITAYGL
jgi:hypothetical protein